MKTILLNSGGLDSLACAMLLNQAGHEVHSLYVDLGYPNDSVARVASALVASTYCADHEVVTVGNLPAMGMADPPTNIGFRPVAYQPMLLHSLAVSLATNKGYSEVCAGVRNNAYVGYEYDTLLNAYLNKFQRLTGYGTVRLSFPINQVNTDDWLYSIVKDSPILHQTVSCLSLPPCGACIKCLIRSKYAI